ncbi:MAG: TIGR03560 family F420-dependent LLM class oxidoreductase [Nitrososphaerales archaeon]
MKINFGIRIVLYQKSFEAIKEYALAAEKLGYDSLWVNDHLLPIVGSIEKPMMESWTVLSSLASITYDIRLGTLVLNNTFRYPQLVAKMVSTLDVISNGRLELGVGAGWFREEHEMFGLPYRKHSERIAMLSEAVELMRNLWTKRRTTYNGKYYDVSNAVCLPKPMQKPHPPLLIGGHSSAILNLVAKYADKSNFIMLSSKEFAKRAELLRDRCESIGRDYYKIRKSFFGEAMVVRSEKQAYEEIKDRLRERRLSVRQGMQYAQRCIIGTPEQCIERIRAYVDADAEEFMLVFPDLDKRQMRLFADSVILCL